MKISQKFKANAGFSLISVLVNAGIFSILITGIIALVASTQRDEKQSEVIENFFSMRNQIINQILDYRAWSNMVNASSNPFFSCIVNQNSAIGANRDCFGQNGILNIYDLSGNLVYDLSSTPPKGFNLKGGVCDGFVDAPSPGNTSCPLRLQLTATAVCASSPCYNPGFKVQGRFSFNGDPKYGVLNLSNLNFDLYLSGLYCPTQPAINFVADIKTQVVTTPLAAVSTEVGAIASSGTVVSSALGLPCRKFQLSLYDDMSSATTPPASMGDANNRSRFCLYNTESSACVFEYRRYYDVTGNTFDLYLSGVKVLSKPSWLGISSSTLLQIRNKNGLVQFYVDGQSIYTFNASLDFPFQIRFYPAGKNYSPSGFNNIGIVYSDL